MSYTIDRTFTGETFAVIVDRTKAALGKHGFGVLTEIDLATTMKNKLGVDVADYVILGACNPTMAYEALKIEPCVGAMLPCNVIVRSLDGGNVMVSAIDPVASMQAIDNSDLKALAGKVGTMLDEVMRTI